MAVKPCSLRIDMQQHEIDNRGTPMFPCGGYVTRVGGCITQCIPWHWHQEVEVMAVAGGTLRLEVPDQTIVAKAGEAVFINAGVLHRAVAADDGVCELHTLVFDPKLVFGSLESAIEQKYVRPLVRCPGLGAIHFTNTPEWQREGLDSIKTAFARYRGEPFGYELLVRDCLSKLWFLIAANHRDEIERCQTAGNTEAARIKDMLCFIHTHYAEPIALKDLAGVAAVSERECARCFQRMLGTTPMKYLLSYRVSVAAGLLTNTDATVTEICRLSGFESPSYFSLKFKALTDMTPREYRRRARSAVATSGA